MKEVSRDIWIVKGIQSAFTDFAYRGRGPGVKECEQPLEAESSPELATSKELGLQTYNLRKWILPKI